MNYGNNNHYQNRYGKQLNEWLLENFTYEEMKAWYRLQIIKYLARKGKKDGESLTKDSTKALDYAKSLSELVFNNTGVYYSDIEIVEEMERRVEEFNRWKG